MSPSPVDLGYFIEVANLSNLSRASEALGISQPSLTLAMRRLEDAIGTALLVRHKRGVTLTKAGEQLLAHAKELLQRWESIKSQALASMDKAQGTVTLGCHPSVALWSLPRFLPKLLGAHPKLEIKLHHDLSRRITEQVISLKLDAAIVVNPVRHPDLVIKHLADDVITLWALDAKRAQQQLKDGTATLICDPELGQSQSILAQIKKSELSYHRIVPTNSLELIADLTEGQGGIGILPGSIAKQHNLQRIPKAPHYDDEICVLYRGENRQVRSIQVVIEAIKQAFGK